MTEDLKKSSFEPHLNDKFVVQTDTVGNVEVELVEVAEHNRENLECFSLLFKAPKDRFFDQKLYKVKHPKMGEVDLFLVPVVHEKQDALYYEAVFNRLLEKK
ncbi:MAG: hypothetical protein GTO45_31205 [Candidatus Aminicenantes bacterium]|nr:hypothetical protein [Candidatus Aminicenantes bacterium]NIM83267.1 hypothetical protein [Candidatus Aminicenantes bacterium]NIN22638.1 hypothetical protein [Candidatus Aminicenantes bacterium]NIN46397.1 hypothetical protein [Candidatus Aminicenantes bacterium]NIN89247.1 hypothetical protein [Candidatus Aminicenantes bacterium]